MRRMLVIFMLFLFPFQVFAARMDGGTPQAVPGGVALSAAQQAAAIDLLLSAQTSEKMFELAAQACVDADEPSANFDIGDTLVLGLHAPLPPRGLPVKPVAVLFAPAVLYPTVPKPPPDA